MRPYPLREVELQIAALESSLGTGTLGQRIRRERISQGISVRKLGLDSGIGASGVNRLESGAPIRPITLIRVCEALGLHLDRLAEPSESNILAIDRCANEKWLPLDEVVAIADEPVESNQLRILKSRLSDGKLLPTVIEVKRKSEDRSHPGEEFVFVLEGSVRLTVSGNVIDLGKGDSVEFWGTEIHSYEPAGGGTARILSVRVNP